MNEKLLEYYKQEIDSLIKKKLIKPSKSHGVLLFFMFKMLLK